VVAWAIAVILTALTTWAVAQSFSRQGAVAKFDLIGVARYRRAHTPGEVPAGAESCDRNEQQIEAREKLQRR
jgi:hypothetical protein